MTKEISLAFLFSVLKSAWWKIILITMVVVIACVAYIQLFIPLKYESTVQFYVVNTNTASEYTQTALLAANEYLANDYITIIEGDRMMDKISNALYNEGFGDFTDNQIRRMIKSSTSSNTSTFEITINSTDRELSYCVANVIQNEAPLIIREVTRPSYVSRFYIKVEEPNGTIVYEKIDESDLECVKVVRHPKLATRHVSLNVTTKALTAGGIAACVIYFIFLILKLYDTVIRSERGARELINANITVIGSIPYWSRFNDKKAEQGGKTQ